jgi:hypothetical protein
MNFSISDLKKHLGPGLGLRKNKYMIEIPVPGVQGETINALCQAAGLPERNMNTTEMWHKGRKYHVRGETDYGGEYEISLIDDSEMAIRRLFDSWMKQVDNSRAAQDKNGSLLGASFEDVTILNELTSGLDLANTVTSALRDVNNSLTNAPRQIVDFFIGQVDTNAQLATSAYQTDVNIWQLSSNQNKVYGYKLQNAFPKSIGIVTLEDGEENSMSEFSVTFAFSEFIPLRGNKEDLLRGVFGDQLYEVPDAFGNLRDNL